MAKPLNMKESLRNRLFNVDHHLAVYFYTHEFNAVWKISDKNKGKVTQFYGDLPETKGDFIAMKGCLKKF